MTDQKKTVLVPVSVALLIPVEVDLPEGLATEHDDLLNAGVLFLADESDDIRDNVLGAFNESAKDNPLIIDAMSSLLAGCMAFQANNPTIRGRYSPCLGIVPEMEI